MARLPRLQIAGMPHLVEQIGHNGQAVFIDDEDRQAYLYALAGASADGGVAIHAYRLERGRIMLLATPREADGLSRLMQRIGRRYTDWFNRRHARSGTLWAGRFRATVVDPETELVPAMRHVESSAGQAGDLAGSPITSSLPHHLGVDHDVLLCDHPRFWALGNTPFERHAAYRLLVTQPLPESERRRFDDAVRKGWAIGSPEFVLALSMRTARRVRPLSPGRPRRGVEPRQ